MNYLYIIVYISLFKFIKSTDEWKQSDIHDKYYQNEDVNNPILIYFGKNEEFVMYNYHKKVYRGHWYRLDLKQLLIGNTQEKDHTIEFEFHNQNDIHFNNTRFKRITSNNKLRLISMLGYNTFRHIDSVQGIPKKVSFGENVLTITNYPINPKHGTWEVFDFEKNWVVGILKDETGDSFWFSVEYVDKDHIIFNKELYKKA